ncbi:MAG: DNA-directed RNA polymerase subunit alpha [bacterium]|nr:DNA-directed RNA polymerase subunit alpha [bacterium]
MSQGISLPNKIYFAEDEKYKSKVVIEPLYPGYGVTIGNALRRVLLSSLPGGAVVAVKIKGVDHEFSTIPNVTEDLVDIILNLKQLRVKVSSDEPVRLTLNVKGQKEAMAKDFKADSRVEIINPELLIATLDNKSSELSMEIVTQQGRGYVPVEMREEEKLEIGMIAVDAIYTPMRNVNFEVENVRVGQITNYDKLTISMETDGTISGREALDIASGILVEHFSLLKTAEDTAAEVSQPEEMELKPVEEAPAVMAAPSDLETFGLSKRAYNALMKNNVRNIEDVKKLTREDLEKMEGLGAKSIDEIMEKINQ